MKEFNSFEEKVAVKKGEVFDVVLESQVVSTGYAWALSSMPNCLNLLEVAYVSTSSSVAGAKVNQVYRFAAVAEAEACLEFSLCRAWEPLNAVQKKVYHVNVSEQESSLEDDLKFSISKDKFLPTDVVNPKVTREQSPVIPYGVPIGVVEGNGQCILKYGVPQGLAKNNENCQLKYGIPASIVEDENNCVVEYGIPLGKSNSDEECVLKYGAPLATNLLYGVPCAKEDAVYPLYKAADSNDIVVVYGVPTLKYGIADATIANASNTDSYCYTPHEFEENENNCVVKYGVPTGIAKDDNDCILKYGAPVLKDNK